MPFVNRLILISLISIFSIGSVAVALDPYAEVNKLADLDIKSYRVVNKTIAIKKIFPDDTDPANVKKRVELSRKGHGFLKENWMKNFDSTFSEAEKKYLESLFASDVYAKLIKLNKNTYNGKDSEKDLEKFLQTNAKK